MLSVCALQFNKPNVHVVVPITPGSSFFSLVACRSLAHNSTSLSERCTDWDVRLPGQSSSYKHCFDLHISSLSSASHKYAMIQWASEDRGYTSSEASESCTNGLHELHWREFSLHLQLDLCFAGAEGTVGNWKTIWWRQEEETDVFHGSLIGVTKQNTCIYSACV